MTNSKVQLVLVLQREPNEVLEATLRRKSDGYFDRILRMPRRRELREARRNFGKSNLGDLDCVDA